MARALSTVGLLALFGTAGSAVAQDANTAGRLTKVEAEVRALQRKVFPGSDGKYFSPEITPGSPTPTPAPLPSTTPLTDVLTRMDALEAQVARMTGQVEQNTNRISQLEAKLAAFAATPAAAPDALGGMTGSPPPSRPANSVTAASPAASPAPSSTPPPPSRVKAVSAIAKPSTSDAIEDE